MNVRSVIPPGLSLALRSMYWRTRQTVSQLGQDEWVFGPVFNGKRNGSFVEVGSADGLLFNNTFLLEKRFGWKGICIEPNPRYFRDLQRIRNAHCFNVCVDEREGEVEFVLNDLFGGIVASDTDNAAAGGRDEGRHVVRVKTRTLASLLEEAGAPAAIDYLSLDVEGAETRVLEGFPFGRFIFRCMTIERPKRSLREILRRNAYVAVSEVPQHDVFFVHESHMETYERNVFLYWGKRSRQARFRR